MQYFLIEMNVDGPLMETLIPTIVAAEHEADAFEVGDALAEHWQDDVGLGGCSVRAVRPLPEGAIDFPETEAWSREDLAEHFEDEKESEEE